MASASLSDLASRFFHGQERLTGPLPAEVGAIVILTTDDGRVSELRAVFDQLGLLRQLGVVPV
jgi:hypothetical protein